MVTLVQERRRNVWIGRWGPPTRVILLLPTSYPAIILSAGPGRLAKGETSVRLRILEAPQLTRLPRRVIVGDRDAPSYVR